MKSKPVGVTIEKTSKDWNPQSTDYESITLPPGPCLHNQIYISIVFYYLLRGTWDQAQRGYSQKIMFPLRGENSRVQTADHGCMSRAVSAFM